MIYLSKFNLLSADQEDTFVLRYPYQLEMQCYSHTNGYPFKLFPQKKLRNLTFEPITVFHGGNGSGKSTLLNIIGEKLHIKTSAPFNSTPLMDEYLKRCEFELSKGTRTLPKDSLKITSDDVFDFLLNIRTINEGIDSRRNDLFVEYDEQHYSPMQPLKSIEDFDKFTSQLESKKQTKSKYVSKRLPAEMDERSNGESAFLYFTQKIKENALYLLDEPENSLSAEHQLDLLKFIEESARFYNCQFIIATHSPFLLSLKGAKIYDLDSVPVCEKHWTELNNVRVYYSFFKERMKDFEKNHGNKST